MAQVVGQFTIDQLYRQPFTRRREFDPDTGEARYVTIEPDRTPSGIRVLDEYINYLSRGGLATRVGFARRSGITTQELNAVIRVLTGLDRDQFLRQFAKRRADDLMRYTTLTLTQVARYSGLNTLATLGKMTREEYHCTPSQRRAALRKKGDAGRYKL